MSIYEENGFMNRQDYLNSLAEEYDIDIKTVGTIAATMGEDEDFDGLVSTLQDMSI